MSAPLCFSALDICLYQNEWKSRWDIMTGFVGSLLIHPLPGCTAHAQESPIFETLIIIPTEPEQKFTANWHITINTRVRSCCTSILMSYTPNRQNIFPDAKSISNSNYISKKEQVSPKPSQTKAAVETIQMWPFMHRWCGWETRRHSKKSSCCMLLFRTT